MKAFLTHLVRLGAVLALAGAVQACGDDDDDDDDDDMAGVDGGTRTDGGPTAGAEVRVLHLSPTTGGVDVFVNGAATPLSNVMFPAASDFVPLTPGSYDFAVAPNGAGVGGAVIDLADFALAAGDSYSFVAWGAVAAGALPAIAIEEDFENLDAGDVRLRVVHAAAGIPTVDVYALAVSAETRLSQGLAPGQSDVVDITLADVPAGLPNVPVLLDAGQDGTVDATFNVPVSVLAGGDRFFSAYAVNDDGPALFVHSRENSDTLTRIDPATAAP